MSGDWDKTKLVALPRNQHSGIGRSVVGYAAESLVIGRALLCGYALFFKAWRDYKTDAILDYRGQTYRIEIKGTGDSSKIGVTSGGRAGEQINRQSASRAKIVSREDADFVFGVHTGSGDSWLIPIEILEILKVGTINLQKVSDFRECWKIFTLDEIHDLGPEGLKTRLTLKDETELHELATKIGASEPLLRHQFAPRIYHQFATRKEALAFAIWCKLGELGQL